MVDVEPVIEQEDKDFLTSMVKKHIKYTDSLLAKRLMESWEESLPNFVKVMPLDYRKALERIKEQETKETEAATITEEVYA